MSGGLESELVGNTGSGAFAPPEVPPELVAQLGPEQRRALRRWLSLLGLLGAGSLVGLASSLYLVNHYPLLLIALSPIGRHLILVAPTVDPLAFVAVASARRLLFYLASFQSGRAMGPAGLAWLETRAARTARFVRWLERLFARASRPVVFLMTGPAISTIAGVSGMRTGVFLGLAGSGLVCRMLLVLVLGAWLREPIEALLAWIDARWVPGTLLIVAVLAVYLRWRGRAAPALAAGLP